MERDTQASLEEVREVLELVQVTRCLFLKKGWIQVRAEDLARGTQPRFVGR